MIHLRKKKKEEHTPKVKKKTGIIQSILNPIKDFTFLPFSAERKIYTDDVWKILDDIVGIEQ